MMILEAIPCHIPLPYTPVAPQPGGGFISAGYVRECWRRQGVMKGLPWHYTALILALITTVLQNKFIFNRNR